MGTYGKRGGDSLDLRHKQIKATPGPFSGGGAAGSFYRMTLRRMANTSSA